MKPDKLTQVLTTLVKNREPVLIKGAPGIGKSDIIQQVAEAAEMALLISHPVVSEPIDYKGLPAIVEGKADFLPFGDLRRMMTAKKPTIVSLDDLGQAPACVQASCMQLLLARAINGKPISENVTFVAATNRRQDKAGVTGILEPVKSRFITILELQPTAEDWVAWALQNGQPSETIGFAHFRPALFGDFKATTDITNSFCPRTLAAAGRLIKMGLKDIETIGGALGEGAATELVGFMKVYQSLPNLDRVLDNPTSAKVPTDPAAQYAVVSGLVEKVVKKNFSNAIKYADRMPSDFSVLFVRDCIRKDESLQHTKAFINWTVRHKDIVQF